VVKDDEVDIYDLPQSEPEPQPKKVAKKKEVPAPSDDDDLSAIVDDWDD
jgi:hypothetical protein